MVRALHERAVQVGELLCRTAELHGLADVVAALFAEGADAARKTDFERYAIADF
jgi:hypothetical protein